jgi:hypothetical protein
MRRIENREREDVTERQEEKTGDISVLLLT